MSGDAGALPEYKLILRTHCRPALGRVESELVVIPGKALARYATRRLQFVVHAASLLHSMVLHGR